ncbi:dethiobiotin synthase [Arthrobacter sp. USHLN218]|uniref:dethiobiotin synthase n=1 Tax=Arthrobacter sp. USHLN218 TaxID=3081232 RepID=UPI003017ECCB
MTTPTQPGPQPLEADTAPGIRGLPRIIFVTGTDTGVGKTRTTAALASALSGHRKGPVAVYKPAQTGVAPDEPGDIDEVRELSGVDRVSEGVRLLHPMAPPAAARREGAVLPGLDDHVRHIRAEAETAAHVLVEGAGGLLVELDGEGHTLADLAARFPDNSATIVVARSGLGTLNHTLLTLEALGTRKLRVGGLVIGCWPSDPDLVETDNLKFFYGLNTPLLGVVPEGTSVLVRPDLLDQFPTVDEQNPNVKLSTSARIRVGGYQTVM